MSKVIFLKSQLSQPELTVISCEIESINVCLTCLTLELCI